MKRQHYQITTRFQYSNGEESSTSTVVNSRAAVDRIITGIREWMRLHDRTIISITTLPIDA
jgi:hypothetical protein